MIDEFTLILKLIGNSKLVLASVETSIISYRNNWDGITLLLSMHNIMHCVLCSNQNIIPQKSILQNLFFYHSNIFFIHNFFNFPIRLSPSRPMVFLDIILYISFFTDYIYLI